MAEFCSLSLWKLWNHENYIKWLGAAELHWFFIQAEEALDLGLYLPATMGLVNGIEASVRFTLHKLAAQSLDDGLGATLSNSLIRRARDAGLPVHALAFPGESDFDAMLAHREPTI